MEVNIQITYNILSKQMIQELRKENKLYKEYIATLEKQIEANHEERNALCRTMEGLGQEVNTLNKRVSTQSSQKIKEAALQHFQQKYKRQCQKTVNLKNKLKDIQEKYEKIRSELAFKQRRIQQLGRSNQKNKHDEAQMEKLTLIILQKDQSMNKYKKQIDFLLKQLKRNEQLQAQTEKQQILVKDQNQKISQLNKIIEDVEKRRKDQFEQAIKQQTSLIQQNNFLKEQKKVLINEKISMSKQIQSLKKERSQLLGQNQQLDCHLKQSKLQVEQLSSELKQYLTTKLTQKDKNKTLNPRQSQQQFNNAFQQLKIQISAIKKGQNQIPQQSIPNKIVRESKQNIVFDLNSPSKWKSIESKLSLLRNTQSMNRFK